MDYLAKIVEIVHQREAMSAEEVINRHGSDIDPRVLDMYEEGLLCAHEVLDHTIDKLAREHAARERAA